MALRQASQYWPYDLATIVISEAELDNVDNVRRVRMADGAVDQRVLNSKALKVRRVTIWVKQANVTDFRNWVRANGTRYFGIRDVDDLEWREMRIVGGRIPLVRQGRQRLEGEAVWRGNAELEGLDDLVVAAPPMP